MESSLSSSPGGGERWLEAVDAKGRTYFYNAKTRETRWRRPSACQV